MDGHRPREPVEAVGRSLYLEAETGRRVRCRPDVVRMRTRRCDRCMLRCQRRSSTGCSSGHFRWRPERHGVPVAARTLPRAWSPCPSAPRRDPHRSRCRQGGSAWPRPSSCRPDRCRQMAYNVPGAQPLIIDKSEMANAGAEQGTGRERPYGSAPDDGDLRIRQSLGRHSSAQLPRLRAGVGALAGTYIDSPVTRLTLSAKTECRPSRR